MTRRTVGWYVHHHGHGHLARMLAVRPHLDADVVVFSSLAPPAALPADTRWVRLDRDDGDELTASGESRSPIDADPTAGGLLHWAPLGHAGHRSRLGRMAWEALRADLSAFVVDVSVEVTLFVRLLGIPVIVVSQPGRRTDEPHRLAYRAATRILAPWPEGALDEPRFDAGADVVHTGGISRFDGRATVPRHERAGIVLLLGSGGHAVDDADIDAFVDAFPEEATTVLGPGRTWLDDPWPAIASASVVVTWAGQNSIADLAAADAAAVVIPQARPFDEQVETGRALAAHGLAVVEDAWPDAWRWPAVVDRARAQDPGWPAWQTRGAAARAASAIAQIADRWGT